MGRSPDDPNAPLLGGAKNPYNFMYPGSGSVSTLNFSDGAASINGGGEVVNDNNNNNNTNQLDETSLVGQEENYDLSGAPTKVKTIDGTGEHKIGQILATAICGNDITSSIFYTSSLCTQFAGPYAPFSLLLVCIVLYLFRKVYGEVGSALPLNGGAYNVLLNTTSKQIASLAAALTIISYVATAVVSGQSAIEYFKNNLVDKVPAVETTIGLLGIFALLNLVGIGESAIVAAVIFAFHMVTLLMLTLGGYFMLFYRHDFTVLSDNWHHITPPDIASSAVCSNATMNYMKPHSSHYQNFAYCIYFGFGAAMLGVTGFETSSNFIEQQKPGVFPKTLRNMWAIVTFFNPLIGLLNLSMLYTCEIAGNNTGLLSEVADKVFGEWFRVWVSIDACMVLSGSVLTAYVGVIGLVRRMALDRCLPQFLLSENKLRKTNHFIILLFFLICTSLYAISDFKTNILSGVYTIAFLGVMSLFAVGNMLLKYKRSSLKRDIKSPWWGVVVALLFVLAALIANIIGDPSNIKYFGLYFFVTAAIILCMFVRARLLKMLLYFSQIILARFSIKDRLSEWIGESIKTINSQSIVFFASKSDPAYLNKAILYIRDNEQTNWVRVIHCYDDEEHGPPADLASNIAFLDNCYPKIRIDLITVRAEFNPSVVEKISNLLSVPKNFMFLSCPKDHLPYSFGDFGGVRMVTWH
eukprot:gene3646-4186_t